MIHRRGFLTLSLATFALMLSGCSLLLTRIVIENDGSAPLSVAASFDTDDASHGFLKANIAVGRWGLLKFLTSGESGTQTALTGTYTIEGVVEDEPFSVDITLGEKNVIIFSDDEAPYVEDEQP